MIAVIAALSAAMAIAAGAFGAHAAAGPLQAEWLKTGGMYQLVHAIAVLSLFRTSRIPSIIMLVGSAIFAFTLYGMAVGAPHWLGAVTPVGGVLMIAGWLGAAWHFKQRLE